MNRPMIEAAAGRLFDIYYQYISTEDLVALQSLTEEAYKVHERLRKLSPNNKGFFELDEFLLLKSLRNHSVHTGEFLGKSYRIKEEFLHQNRMDLARVCLVEKQIVHQAINAEPQLESGEELKVSKIRKQLIVLGDYYNIEPVIFNFMVKVYEILVALKLSVPGQGFAEMNETYQKEIYHNYPHYVQLRYSAVNNTQLLDNLMPLENAYKYYKEELSTEENDPFNSISFLDHDYSNYKVADFGDSFYEKMRETVLSKILKDDKLTNLSITLPKHLGLGFVSSNETTPPLTIKRFNIRKQSEEFERCKIKLDSYFYETSPYELLVLFTYEEQIFPIVINKDELIKKQRQNKQSSYESQFMKKTIDKPKTHIGRNDPCYCGSGKKYKKCCLH